MKGRVNSDERINISLGFQSVHFYDGNQDILITIAQRQFTPIALN